MRSNQSAHRKTITDTTCSTAELVERLIELRGQAEQPPKQ